MNIDNYVQLPEKRIISLQGEIDYYGARYVLSGYCGIDLTTKPISNVPWSHGWIPDFWNNTDPRLVTSQNLTDKSQLILTSKSNVESYLRSCGYENAHAIGLPIIYLPKRKIERLKNSLLVMPAHSLDYTTHNHWKFEQYVKEIEEIAHHFEHIYICVHPSCLKKGYWVRDFQAKGFKVLEGMGANDRNALFRLQYLMNRFEYVTTNAFGSHIAYAAYFGAKVSIYGSYAEFKEEDFRHDPFYSKNPKLLAVALNLTSESKVRKELSHLFVLPHKAKILTEWGKYEVGEANKKSVSQLYKILKITFKDRMVATLGRLGSTSKKIIKSVLPKKTRQFINLHFRGIEEPSEPDEIQKELSRISQLPRFIKGETNILGKIIKFVDSASFCFMHNKIFEREVYKFQTKSSRPYIIDAGANVGLSVIYFKKLYPNAEIIALEPDNKIFEALTFNIKSFGFENVQLIQKALWNEETILRFYSEGADGGRIATQTDSGKLIEVSTCRLRDFLNKKVDLLKMDIEGAEVIVLEDCSDLLHNVERLFVEYHSFVGKEQKLYKLLEILEKAGFRYQVQHVGVFSQHPFIRISEYLSMDLQLNIFAYRI